MMAVLPDGGLYITRRDQGDVLLLRDKDGDGRFEDLTTVLTKFTGVHGITIHDGWLYLISIRELKRAKIKSDGSLEEAQLLIKDLPDAGQHPNRTIAFGPDGMLYITVGSTCNDCMDSNPENATILQAKPDGSARRIYARGLRNTIGIDWNAQTGALWGADNGADYKGDNIPPDEINQIKDSAHYGWPWIWADKQVDPTRENPPGTTKDSFAKKTEGMKLALPAHAAPIAFMFLDKTTFPQEYKGDALVTLHGSWNRSQPDGYLVQRVHFENGQAVSNEDFLTGFLNNETKSRFGRPCGLAVSPKGVVYLSDDENGVIYSISAAAQ